jgi:phospholipase C
MDASADSADPIKHVIVLMMENRSFDQMLGSLHPGAGMALGPAFKFTTNH